MKILYGSHSWPHPMIRGGRRPSLLLALRVVARYTARKVMLQNMPNPPIVEDGSLVPTAAVRALLRNLPLCPMPNLFTVGFVRNPFALKAVARCFQTKARHLGMLALLTTSTGFPVKAAGKHFTEKHTAKLHAHSVHGKAKVTCPDGCGMTFASLSNARTHSKQHHGEGNRNFPCTGGCDKKFTSKGNAQRHEQLCHQNKMTEYICTRPRYINTLKVQGCT